ncbi:MAG: L-2-amino-thiazoline-4-carboxylic acid hydrolase [Desulfatibacillum sp.]|nr:L-2-amino-thiazoline-4-carboxylic acid hydrolase [Desulfatibacillum sp.]
MKIEQLKNYGKPLNETTRSFPFPTMAVIVKDALWVLVKNLGLATSFKVLRDTREEKARMSAVNLDEIRENGCSDEVFIAHMAQAAAFFSSMKNHIGLEKTMEVHRKIMDKVAGPMNLAILPPASDIRKFRGKQEEFAAFRQYVLALWEADQQAGLHKFDLVENSDQALAINVNYCAYSRIPQLLGVGDACECYCYSDEVFFPGFLEPFGIRFVRNQTLGRKGTQCDFRFEKTAE